MRPATSIVKRGNENLCGSRIADLCSDCFTSPAAYCLGNAFTPKRGQLVGFGICTS